MRRLTVLYGEYYHSISRRRYIVKRVFIMALVGLVFAVGAASGAQYRQLAGQMIGVSYGGPTEFRAQGKIYEKDIPAWRAERVQDSLGQDDVYVEMSFLEAIEKYGLDITYEEAGKSFAETRFPLWHANNEGRKNVRNGIMPPDSGSPKYNPHCDDIDIQIESDLFGLINPGLPRSSNAICDKFGRVMNSGNGLYGGLFISAMYTQAFFERDVGKVVRNALRAIPAWSIYAKTIRDVMLWHKLYPDDWRATWQRVQDKWAAHPSGRCSTDPKGFNIDANLNGAYVVMGLLYGDGDLGKTLEIATRCGQDSDCNPANASGVLCTILGYSGMPDEYKGGISAISDRKFAEVKYTFNSVVPTCLKYARENIKRAGGSSKVVGGREVFLIPVQYPLAPKLER